MLLLLPQRTSEERRLHYANVYWIFLLSITAYTAWSIAITEILRTLHILKKRCEDIQVEWKAHSEEKLLLVNKSMQVSHVNLLPRSLGPQGSNLSVTGCPGFRLNLDTGLVQAPMQNTDRKGLESPRMLHTHLPLTRPLRWHYYRV